MEQTIAKANAALRRPLLPQPEHLAPGFGQHLRRPRSLWRRLALWVGLLVWLWGSGLLAFAWLVSNRPSGAGAADAVVVFTGPEEARIALGFSLYDAGAAPRLLVSGVGPGHDEASLRMLLLHRRPETTCCVAVDQANDTLENARMAAAWAERVQARVVRLVTADYHMPRAAWLLRRALPPGVVVDQQPVVVRDGRAGLVLMEYHKYLTQRLLAAFGEI